MYADLKIKQMMTLMLLDGKADRSTDVCNEVSHTEQLTLRKSSHLLPLSP